jgi:hypothetical protein
LTTAAGCIATPDASKEFDVASSSTGGKMDDISFRGVEREAVVEEPLMYASAVHDYNGGLRSHCALSHLRLQLYAIGVLMMMDAKRLDHFRQWRNVQWNSTGPSDASCGIPVLTVAVSDVPGPNLTNAVLELN